MTVLGLDEAGRGPLAGPVCAAAVVFDHSYRSVLLSDSKKLSEKQRYAAMAEISEQALAWAVGWASAAEIDELNILNASLLAMKRAYDGIGIPVDLVVVDGLYVPDGIQEKAQAQIKADASVPAVMAASILAKNARDRMMIRYGWLYPEYEFEKHKGYPTRAHMEHIQHYGSSPIQRKSFKIRARQDLFSFD